MKKGKDLIIKMKNSAGKYVVIAASTSCDIDSVGDVIEVSSPTSGKAREFIPGRTSWSVKVNRLYSDTASPFADILKAGSEVELSMGLISKMVATTDYVGKAICTSCNVSAQVGHLVSGSIAFQGTGELKPDTPRPAL